MPTLKETDELKLIYRLGEHEGWDAGKFQSQVYNRGPTLVLVKSGAGWVSGGYTKATWKNSKHTSVFDDTAFLFSVTNKVKYPVLKPEKAIAIGVVDCRGIVFGCWNLGFGRDGNNRYAHSCFGPGQGGSDPSVYGTHSVNGKSPLTGEGSYNFNLKEVEIYEIIHH